MNVGYSPEQQGLADLAERIRSAGWRTPAFFLLSAISPLSFVARQLLLLTLPLWGAGSVGRYALMLDKPTAWDELVTLLREEARP